MHISFQRLVRRQLSETLAHYSAATPTSKPRDGWIAALREALNMTVRQFAARLGVTPSSVVRLERRERDETISLGALRRAADALDCDLVYAVVPRRTATTEPSDNVLDAVIEARAREVAASEFSRLAHTMALEDQAVRAAELETQIAERAVALAETPRRLWDAKVTSPDTPRSTARRGLPR